MYTKQAIQKILEQVAKNKISPAKAYEKLKHLPYETLPFAKLDHHRTIRKNLPEVVYAPGKTLSQLNQLVRALGKTDTAILVTRLEEKKFRQLKRLHPKLSYSKPGQIAFTNHRPKKAARGLVSIVTAGTSDIPVAEEARITLETLGRGVLSFYDLGVAGLHRLLDHLKEIQSADVVICIAGMEGALPSVLAGLISKPIIAVPTSVGYGANFKGIAPLLTMLNTCAQGVAVVNVDSGFNAACFAHLVLSS